MSSRPLLQQLEQYERVGLLQAVDLEFTRILDIDDENAALAAVLASYWFRKGNVCLDLTAFAGRELFKEELTNGRNLPPIKAPRLDEWAKQLKNTSFIGNPGDFKPLIFDKKNRLYLQKLWYNEKLIGDKLLLKASKWAKDINPELLQQGLNRYFSSNDLFEINWQQVAAAKSVLKLLSVISGGPGTGKTTTVVRILALLIEQSIAAGNKLEVALAAPTGKAAARLKESVQEQKENLPAAEEVREAIPEKAKTLHQLLGARRHSSTFKYHKDNPLPYDLVVVDEASMVDQSLMSKLMEAMPDDARLILLGDKDQLASVEAGSVLGDICDIDENQISKEMASELLPVLPNAAEILVSESPKALTDNITLLTKSYRFDAKSGIAELAESINQGDENSALKILNSAKAEDVRLTGIPDQTALENLLKEKVISSFKKIIQSDSVKDAMNIFNRFRILSAHRKGPLGVEYLNSLVEKLLQGQGLISKQRQWYAGRPVIINENDYTLKLYNGDTGLCLPDDNGDLKVFFEHEKSFRSISPTRLPAHETAYALTIHKSQGSEFDEVVLILPANHSKLLSRELLYTGLSRARTKITIVGNKAIFAEGIKAHFTRSSGLRDILWD
ncbi:MAG TPA: exodeoxyribonuclease V subunit alpha [Balneolaceae bacterium]|nr:exodeoxyribonuclease V subunit alpha [Balneolaceae bacterium]